MRILLAATMAASVLAIGASMEPAASLPLGGQADNPGAVHRVQQMTPGPSTERGTRFERGERGMRGDSPRLGQPRGYIDGGRDLRRSEREWRRGHRDEWRGGRDWGRFGGYGYRGGDCRWLRRRAVETGSRYWWRRYRDCMR
jgi:hypothetical protein